MQVQIIVGARPQFIKTAALIRAMGQDGRLEPVLVHTGQHYDSNMSQVFFDELSIPAPARSLGVGSGTHGAMTGRMLERIESLLLTRPPAAVVVLGDTNSTLAGALAAAKLNIPVVHVEAGLRSRNRAMPEEINRIMADHVSTLLFAPTRAAVDNLAREGFGAAALDGRLLTPDQAASLPKLSDLPAPLTVNAGDVMYDTALFFGARAREQSAILDQLGLAPGGYVLATVHRAENTDDPERLRGIFTALRRTARDMPVVLPLHPRTRAKLEKGGELQELTAGLSVTEPLGYLDMVRLEMDARAICTDSGGVQKEAFFHGVPCVTLRDETEWVELVEGGFNIVAGAGTDGILKALAAAMESKPGRADFYGTGQAAQTMAMVLAHMLA